jgi:arylsulfatase A-like enzyme
VIHAAAFALVLLSLRADKIVVSQLSVTPGLWAQALCSELSLLLIIEASWLLTIRVLPARTSWWATAYLAFHVPIYLLAVTSHGFFRETGIIPRSELLNYAVNEFSTLRELLETGVDLRLTLSLLAVAACLLSVLLTLRYSRRQRWGNSILIPGLMTLTGASLVLVPEPHHVKLAPLSGNWITDLLPDPALESYLARRVQPYPVYSPPVLDLARGDAVVVRPNFLFVVLESTRTDLSTTYTGKPSLTPFLDELAAKSLVVDNAYTTVSHTTKALVGILCGTKPAPMMENIEAKPGGLPATCLPKLLREAGYSSGYFQAAGNFEYRRDLVANIGFDHAFIPDPKQAAGFARVGYLGWEERVMMSPALEWMAGAQRPFLATLLTLSTHHPYESAGSGRAPKEHTARRAYYDRAVAYVDNELRLLFQQLEQRKILDNTIVFIVGDHGEAFGERNGFLQHDRVPYEEVARTPLLIYAPELISPGRIAGLRQHTDILPTALELAHLPWRGLLPGRSLLSSPGHNLVISSCWYAAACLSLRTGDLSFVFHFGRIPLEIFDLRQDPGQQHDISAQFDEALKEQAIDMMLAESVSYQRYYATAASGGAPSTGAGSKPDVAHQ